MTLHTQRLCAWLAGAFILTPAMSQTMSQTPPAQDPYLWLEDVQGERALQWVRERNADSEGQLQARPGFQDRKRLIREVLDSREQIPYVTRQGEWFYNFWRDAKNPRGLWRTPRWPSSARPSRPGRR